MSNTLSVSYITQLPQLTPQGLYLKLQMENWQKVRAEAGSQKERAWRKYQDAVDNELPRAEIDELYQFACMFENIHDEAYAEHENAKKQYLDLMS